MTDEHVESLTLREAAGEAVAWSVYEETPGNYRCRGCDADMTHQPFTHDEVYGCVFADLSRSLDAARDAARQPADWQEEARRENENATYWRKRAERCEAAVRQPAEPLTETVVVDRAAWEYMLERASRAPHDARQPAIERVQLAANHLSAGEDAAALAILDAVLRDAARRPRLPDCLYSEEPEADDS